ncbi:hypothetical protein H0H92_013760 [Tricholoma furcatifolium]|nr:hypothetical protein H0H92_013760 [Tricholoma furcatifolium]
MYHLLKGLHEHLTRKEEFSVIIIGLDGAGKTTLYLDSPRENQDPLQQDTRARPGQDSSNHWAEQYALPSDAHPLLSGLVSSAAGTITLPSSILQFWDLGGQRGIRNIWSKYYDDAHAVVYVIDAEDRERLGEGWEVFDAVLTAPQILNVPLLLLANKQDSPESLSVEEIRHDYEDWYQRKMESARRDTRYGQPESERVARKERIASLEDWSQRSSRLAIHTRAE